MIRFALPCPNCKEKKAYLRFGECHMVLAREYEQDIILFIHCQSCGIEYACITSSGKPMIFAASLLDTRSPDEEVDDDFPT